MIRRTNKHVRRRNSPGLGNTATPLPATPAFTLTDPTHLAVSFDQAIAVGVLDPTALAGWTITGADSGAQTITAIAAAGNGFVLELDPGSSAEVLTIAVPPRANPRTTLGGYTQSGTYTLGTALCFCTLTMSVFPGPQTMSFDGAAIDLGAPGASCTVYQATGTVSGDTTLDGSWEEADSSGGPWTALADSAFGLTAAANSLFTRFPTATKRWVRYTADLAGTLPTLELGAWLTVP